MAKLIVVTGPDKNLEYSIDEEIIVGRQSGNNIPLADSKASRRHSKIFVRDCAYFIEDMGSRNGTQVNGKNIEKTWQLHCGDRITVGDTSFVFVDEDIKKARKSPPSPFVESKQQKNITEKSQKKPVKLEKSKAPALREIKLEKTNKAPKSEKSRKTLKEKKFSSRKVEKSNFSSIRFFSEKNSQKIKQNPVIEKLVYIVGILLLMFVIVFVSRWVTLWLLE